MTTADRAAAQTIPGCADANELLTQLEIMNKHQPHKARALYFQWKATTDIMARYPVMEGADAVQYGQETPRRSDYSPGPERPTEEAAHA